jgi:hypothetical protein
MGLINDLLTKPVEELVNITDAQYPGDDGGTDAKAAYFIGNNHNYFQSLAKALIEVNACYVNPRIAGLTEIGAPFYATIADAHNSITGSGDNNRYTIYVDNCATGYDETLSLNKANAFITIEGLSKYGNKITGALGITDGKYILRNLLFANSITQSGGECNIENCSQISGDTAIEGSSTMVINKCGYWGGITVSGNNNKVWIEHLDGCNKDITITPGMTGGTYLIHDVGMEGNLIDTTALAIFSNLRPGLPERPKY